MAVAASAASAAAQWRRSGGVVGVGGSAQDLVNSPSIQSLLGLLRSSSAASLGHLGTDPDSRAASMLQLSSLAGQLAASPSAADLLGAAGEHLRRNGSSNAMLANLAALAARGGVGADGIAAAVAAAAPQLQLQSAGGGSSTADAARGGAGVVGAHGRGMDSAHMPPPAGTPIKLGGAVGEGEVRPPPATAPRPCPRQPLLRCLGAALHVQPYPTLALGKPPSPSPAPLPSLSPSPSHSSSSASLPCSSKQMSVSPSPPTFLTISHRVC